MNHQPITLHGYYDKPRYNYFLYIICICICLYLIYVVWWLTIFVVQIQTGGIGFPTLFPVLQYYTCVRATRFSVKNDLLTRYGSHLLYSPTTTAPMGSRCPPSFINCLILSRQARGMTVVSKRERENRFVSFSYSPLPIYVCCSTHAIHLPIPRTHVHVTISNRSRYSSSTASGRQSFIVMSSGAVMNVLLGTKSGQGNDDNDDVMKGALKTYITPFPMRICICTASGVSLPVGHSLLAAVPHVNTRFRNQV